MSSCLQHPREEQPGGHPPGDEPEHLLPEGARWVLLREVSQQGSVGVGLVMWCERLYTGSSGNKNNEDVEKICKYIKYIH